ncbi:hypothetical protein KIN20_010459 [Parelaphostrongylus tenuis]|uniref:Uncharacterized protein n=1 Tax=Parelaphostrongylus tenuis TaxID=148309 RepID=A0AAD5MRY8_PARTN|nr:hypothetical protein KIN20_010459 [Parelaphostrongylus tenuis]
MEGKNVNGAVFSYVLAYFCLIELAWNPAFVRQETILKVRPKIVDSSSLHHRDIDKLLTYFLR